MSRPLSNVSEAYYMLLQEEHQREMSSEVHITPQSAALYNSSNNLGGQESLGLMGKNAGFNNLGGKSNGYSGSHNWSNNGNNGYPNSGSNSYSHNGGNAYLPHKNIVSRRQFFI